MKSFRTKNNRHSERGVSLIVFCILVTVFLLLLGLVIDFGYAYVTKASLSKAVDAACLTGVRNLSAGNATAEQLARSTFALNYGTSGRDVNSPVVNVVFSTDASGNTLMSIDATATIKTFFMRILPAYNTLSVKAAAQATRAKLIMTVVLDRSGSMSTNGGGVALPPAVGTFVDYFDDAHDNVAMSSFASNATLDVSMRTGFKTPIKNAANGMVFDGGTFAPGGLGFAPVQNDSIPVAPGENVVKVAVFFTDGLANIIQDTLPCTTGGAKLWNFGGYDPVTNNVGFFTPATGVQNTACTLSDTSGRTAPTACCTGVTRFTSAIPPKSPTIFIRANVTNDAEYRAVQIANAMRAEGMIVYSIGLGNNINQDFLQQIANDPASSTYDPTKPVGSAVFAPTAAELQGVFQTIASKILLRLTQ